MHVNETWKKQRLYSVQLMCTFDRRVVVKDDKLSAAGVAYCIEHCYDDELVVVSVRLER